MEIREIRTANKPTLATSPYSNYRNVNKRNKDEPPSIPANTEIKKTAPCCLGPYTIHLNNNPLGLA